MLLFLSLKNQKGELASERNLQTSSDEIISDNGSLVLPNNTNTTAPTSIQSFFFNSHKALVKFCIIIFLQCNLSFFCLTTCLI